MIKAALDRLLAPFGYLLVRKDAHQALAERLANATADLQRLGEELKQKDAKIKKLGRRVDDRTRELEETRLKLQRALRDELERQFADLKTSS
jgi:uncharacterized protein (DUF3084 family)